MSIDSQAVHVLFQFAGLAAAKCRVAACWLAVCLPDPDIGLASAMGSWCLPLLTHCRTWSVKGPDLNDAATLKWFKEGCATIDAPLAEPHCD